MTQITARVINLAEFRSAMEKVSSSMGETALRAAINAGAHQMEALIKLKISSIGLVDKGVLINSIQKKDVTVTATSAKATVGTNVVYAAIHEFGGVIVPRHAAALVFRTKDGMWHTVKRVVMPARPYMRPAIDGGKNRIEQAVVITLKRFLGVA